MYVAAGTISADVEVRDHCHIERLISPHDRVSQHMAWLVGDVIVHFAVNSYRCSYVVYRCR